jgi:hypothetical protein
MRPFGSRGEAALYVWDYFYISHVPARGDEEPWAIIERATHRIRESEMYLDGPRPPDVRVRSARRVRNAVHAAMRQIERLSNPPALWVVEELGRLAAEATVVIETLREAAARVVVD